MGENDPPRTPHGSNDVLPSAGTVNEAPASQDLSEDGQKQQEANNKPSVIRQIAAAGFHSANGLRNGFYAAYTAVGIPTFMTDPNRPFDLSIHERSLFASLGTFASMTAATMSGTFAGTVGQCVGTHRALTVMLVPTWLAWFMIAFPINSTMMIAGRVMQGCFSGFIVSMAQVYTSEVAHKSLRGFLLSTSMISFSFGLLLADILGAFVTWRTLAVTCAILNFLFLPLLLILPPSPVQLLKKGKEEEALKALVWLRGPQYDSRAELEDMKMHIREAQERQPSHKEMLRFSYLKPLFIAAALLMLRQFTGYFAVVFFTVDIFRAAHSAINPNLATIIVGSIVLTFTITAGLLVDRIGRKRLAVLAAFTMALVNAILAIYFHFEDKVQGTVFAWLPLPLMLVLVIANSLGITHLQNLVLGELLPLQIKTQATGFLFALSGLALFLTLLGFEYMRTGIGNSATFGVFSGGCLAIFAVCLLFLPETKGRTLREIEADVTQGKSQQHEMSSGNESKE